jgi:RecA-family ATPase
MIESYPFGQVFQMRLLVLLVQQPQKVLGIVEPQYFTIGNYVDVSRIALEIYAKYLPKKPDFRLDYESLKEAVYATETDSHRRHNFKRLLKDIFRMSPDDSPFLIDQARGFAKVWQYRETLIAAERDVTNRNYDRVHERFDKLRSSPNGTSDGGLNWDNVPRFDPNAVQNTKWLVEILFAEGTLSLIYGPRGVFKSTFVLAAGGAVANEEEFLGMKTRKRKVLYLDYENPPDVIKNRVMDLRLGLPEN